MASSKTKQKNTMPRHCDPLTYKHPRTTIDAFGCDATQARAGWKYINWTQIVIDGVSVLVLAGVLTALALAYFDVLVK